MFDQIPAIFRDGVFHPVEPCALPDETKVVVVLPATTARVIPPAEPDPEKRRLILRQLTERWRTNPLSPEAPRLTRDELHERR